MIKHWLGIKQGNLPFQQCLRYIKRNSMEVFKMIKRANVLRNIQNIVGKSDKESNVTERVVFCIKCGSQVFDTQPGYHNSMSCFLDPSPRSIGAQDRLSKKQKDKNLAFLCGMECYTLVCLIVFCQNYLNLIQPLLNYFTPFFFRLDVNTNSLYSFTYNCCRSAA